MAWWDVIWLNEAFATWLQQSMTAAWKTEWSTRVDDVNSRLGYCVADYPPALSVALSGGDVKQRLTPVERLKLLGGAKLLGIQAPFSVNTVRAANWPKGSKSCHARSMTI